MVVVEKRPENVATEIYFALCAGLVMLAFLGSIAYVTEPAEVMSYSLLYLLLLTFLFGIYKNKHRRVKIRFWKRKDPYEEDDTD